MEKNKPLTDISEINFNTLDNILKFFCVYHQKEDVLFLGPPQPVAAVSIDLNGELWLRVEPLSKEIVGIEIEDFQLIFLKNHPELSDAWKAIKVKCRNRKAIESNDNPALKIILSFAQNFVRVNLRLLLPDLLVA